MDVQMANTPISQIEALWKKSPVFRDMNVSKLTDLTDAELTTVVNKVRTTKDPKATAIELNVSHARAYWKQQYSQHINLFLSAAVKLSDAELLQFNLIKPLNDIYTALHACHNEAYIQQVHINSSLQQVGSAAKTLEVCASLHDFSETVGVAIAGSSAEKAVQSRKVASSKKSTQAESQAIDGLMADLAATMQRVNSESDAIHAKFKHVKPTIDSFEKKFSQAKASGEDMLLKMFSDAQNSLLPGKVMKKIDDFIKACDDSIEGFSEIKKIKSFDENNLISKVNQLRHIHSITKQIKASRHSALSRFWWLFFIALMIAGVVCLAYYSYSAHIPVLYFATGLGLTGLAFIGLCVNEYMTTRKLYVSNEVLPTKVSKPKVGLDLVDIDLEGPEIAYVPLSPLLHGSSSV